MDTNHYSIDCNEKPFYIEPLPIFTGAIWFGFLNIFCASEEGGYSPFMLKWQIGNNYIHIHHWMYYLCAFLLLLWMSDFAGKDILLGLFAGGIIHGLTYSDWYKIWYPV